MQENQSAKQSAPPAKVYGLSFGINYQFSNRSLTLLAKESYLIFADFESASKVLSTSICGPTRFTGKVATSQFQRKVAVENIASIDQLCTAAESRARRLRIIRQDRIDAQAYEVEALRLMKEGLGQSRVEYEQALEEAKPHRDVEKQEN